MAAITRSLLAGLLAASLGTTAPARAQQTVPPKLQQHKTPESELLSPDDLALRRKLQPFIHCLNDVGSPMPTLVNTYRHAFAVLNKNPRAQFSKMDYWFVQQYTGQVFGLPGQRVALKCADGLAAVPNSPPADPDLDALATRYAEGLRRLDALAPKVEKYYNEQNYKDDGMALGRTLNAEYEPVLAELSADTHAMFAEVQKRTDGIDERRVDAIAQHDGKRGRWEANAFMLQARVTMRALDRMVADKALSKDQVVAAITPLETRFEEADAYFKEHPEENTDDMDLWDGVRSYAETFVTQAKQTRRAATDGKPFIYMADSIDYLRHEYNGVVDAANTRKR